MTGGAWACQSCRMDPWERWKQYDRGNGEYPFEQCCVSCDHTLPSSELDAMRAQLARNSGTTPGHSADVRTSATESDRISGNECPVERASDLSGNRS